ncbi:MAG TPA: SusD/RagB family nutrient-binding outer membrane lipoprotein, partial [Chryseosolibacter sp.]|nr:SusD/RagB family nutrient-binding outer membrane lipoprotein [Chryseosolibacter sp.]
DSVLVETLLNLDDPRIGVFADEVEIPLVVSDAFPAGTDEIVTDPNTGKKTRHLSPDVVGDQYVNTHPQYVGYPTQLAQPSLYNLNPNAAIQGAYNPHASQLNEMYKQASGPLLKARLLSAAEVHFILAEAALKGWAVGSAQDHYEAGVRASFETWDVDGDFSDYIAGNAAYNGTLEQIMTQKWIASWTAAAESWFDYRRTGFPALKTGEYTFRSVMPVRFPYGDNETKLNSVNVDAALNRIEETPFTQADGLNSAWSKPWLLQGTGKPW